jgi:hypothetical protein
MEEILKEKFLLDYDDAQRVITTRASVIEHRKMSIRFRV